MTGLSVGELEEQIAANSRSAPEPLPPNLHHQDLYFLLEQRRKEKSQNDFMDAELRKVIARLSHRVYDYLGTVEKALSLGRLQADIFEHNRRYVDSKLVSFSPESFEQLRAAYQRTREGTPEARSHALTSCRRVLKSLADRLYPARAEPVRGADGKERVLNDSLFIARLWQFIAEANAGESATRMLSEDVERLGVQVDRLYSLSSKGVHAEVSEFEVNMCVLNLYSVVGALLRLHEGSSAASIDPDELGRN
jgi:hypothetical protein